MAAIQARAPPHEDDEDGGREPKNALMAAIQARAPPYEDEEGGSKPKNALMAAIQARAPPHEEKEGGKKPHHVLMAAIQSRASVDEDGDTVGPILMPPCPPGLPPNPLVALNPGTALLRPPPMKKSNCFKTFGAGDITIDQAQRMTCSKIMRGIDDMRNHMPSEWEMEHCSMLSERRNSHEVYQSLDILGARRGVRLSTKEMRELIELLSELEFIYQKLDSQFKCLPRESKSIVMSKVGEVNQVKQLEDVALQERIHFQNFVEEYLEKRKRYVEFVLKKRAQIPEAAEQIMTDNRSEIPSTALPMPAWLRELTQVYTSEANATPNRLDENLPDSVGRFASFMAHLLTSGTLLRSSEKEALSVLLHASNCGDSSSYSNCDGDDSGGTEKYWSRRFWKFLKNLRELSTVPKGGKYLSNKCEWCF